MLRVILTKALVYPAYPSRQPAKLTAKVLTMLNTEAAETPVTPDT